MLGEGIAMFALKRLADAERDGDRVHAVIRGIGSSSDGSGTSVYAPLATGQARALRRAYAAAGYGPDTVGLVEAHGTGTTAGDAAEVAALRAVFTETGRGDRQWCALGSVKSQIGHTKTAAGAAGLLKATLALRHRVLPPTIKVERPHPELGLEDSPFYLNTVARPWVHTADHPRRVSVSSFGFGGSNFHVTLEEYTGRDAVRCVARPTELVVLSAGSPQELFSTDLSGSLPAVAWRSQEAFSATDPARLAVVASSTEDLARKLEQARGLVSAQPVSTPTGAHYGAGRATGRIAFLFPGQGAQYVGMGTGLALHFPQAHAVWNRQAVAELVFPRPVFTDAERQAQREALTDTRWAQPAIAAHSLALLTVLDAVGVRPDCVAGHSFGELVALHAARVFDEDTLLRLATRRGELMHDAPGIMLALDATVEQAADLLAQHGIEEVWIANHNAPRQVVVSATAEAGTLVEKCAAERGIAFRRLGTSAGFHSPLVAASARPLQDFLAHQVVRAPLLDVYGNTAAAMHPAEPASIRQAIVDHLAAPVRFADMIRTMYADGARIFVEVGPSGALTRLVGQIIGDVPHHAIAMDRPGRHDVTGLHDALARLAVLGVPLAFEELWASHEPVRAAAPRPAMPVVVSGGNHGRRYPPNEQFAPSAPAPVLHTSQPPAPAALDGEVARAVLAAQQETARAHAAYLSMAEKSIDAMMAMSGSSSVSWVPAPIPVSMPTPVATPVPTVPEPVPVKPVAAPVVPVTLGNADELEAMVLTAVSEKTGYPVEILAPHMELEADLGLDSITRTQVLAALRLLLPQLETID
ncbi:MAG: acyltransferase domain-containing protein, partial [Actinomycetes bacterium]